MLINTPVDDLPAAIRSPAAWWAPENRGGLAILATRPVACPACGQTRLLYVVCQAPEPGQVIVGCLSDCARQENW